MLPSRNRICFCSSVRAERQDALSAVFSRSEHVLVSSKARLAHVFFPLPPVFPLSFKVHVRERRKAEVENSLFSTLFSLFGS